MPSIKELAGLIAILYVTTMVTGNGEKFWLAVKTLRHHFLVENKKDWGCPSIFHKNACSSYDPSRYK